METVLTPHDGEYDRARVRCPYCGSYEIHEFRQAIVRYRLSRTTAVCEAILKESEDPIFHRCMDCQYGSGDDTWEV